MNYDEIIDILQKMAETKMSMNAHKGNIEDCTPNQIMNFLKKEVEELGRAIEMGDDVKIIEEAGDCLNFLIAISKIAVNDYRNRK